MAPKLTRDPRRQPAHPGALLREIILPAIGKPKAEIARALGVSRETLYKVLGERQSITPDLAARLGKLCGNGPALWLRMQAAYDAWLAASVDVSGIPTLGVGWDVAA
jgi:addiction module HigA family antidote